MLAEEWVQSETLRLETRFASEGKAPRIFEPKESLFASPEEWEFAKNMQVKLCDKDHHDD